MVSAAGNQPLLSPSSRQASLILPTPFSAAASVPLEGGAPPREAGGVLRNKYGRYRDWTDQRARTTVLIFLAGVLERTNEQTLPALYKYVGRSLHASPRQLGYITLGCALLQAVCAPIGGLLGHYHNRVHVLSAGCFLWAAFAAAFAFCSSFATGAIFWSLNGLGLALLIPNAQSLVADYYRPTSRGKAFGGLFLTGALGGMLGALYATNLGHTRPFGLLEGWRVAFLSVAALSAGVGVLCLWAAVDPRYKIEDARYAQEADIYKQRPVKLAQVLAEIASVLAVPSFVIVVLQGVLGSTPWNALVFNTLWLQLQGFSDFHASLIASLFLLGTALGAQLGGILGDWAAERSPNHGRIIVAQVSVGIGVPLAVVVYKLLPLGTSPLYVALYGTSFAVWGLLISWAGAATTSPIFGEVVPAQQRSLVYSFDRAFEGAFAAMGAPIVGALAERMGFSGKGSGEPDLASAHALGDAMVICTALPWALCALFFSGLHVTYKRDRIAALTYTQARSGYVTLSPPELAALEGWEGDEEDEADQEAALAVLGTRRMPLPGGVVHRGMGSTRSASMVVGRRQTAPREKSQALVRSM